MKQLILKICGYLADVIFGTSGEKRSVKNEDIYLLPLAENCEENITSLFHYKNAKVKKLIWGIKYDGDRRPLKIIAELIYDRIISDLSESYLFETPIKTLVLPIPATKRRIKENGFNQCERIVKELEKIDKGNLFEIDCNILVKKKETPSQAHTKNKQERLANLKDSFEVGNPEKIFGKNIILIDDVWTTGATIKEASAALFECGARKVVTYTLAH